MFFKTCDSQKEKKGAMWGREKLEEMRGIRLGLTTWESEGDKGTGGN